MSLLGNLLGRRSGPHALGALLFNRPWAIRESAMETLATVALNVARTLPASARRDPEVEAEVGLAVAGAVAKGALAFLLGPVGLVVAGFTALVTMAIGVTDSWEQVKIAAKSFRDDIVNLVIHPIENAIDVLGALRDLKPVPDGRRHERLRRSEPRGRVLRPTDRPTQPARRGAQRPRGREHVRAQRADGQGGRRGKQRRALPSRHDRRAWHPRRRRLQPGRCGTVSWQDTLKVAVLRGVPIRVEGGGMLGGAKLANQDYQEGTTVFDFSNLSGAHAIYVNGTTNAAERHQFSNFSVFCNSSVAGWKSFNGSYNTIRHVGVGQDGTGDGFDFEDYFGYTHFDLLAAGTNWNGTAGTVQANSVAYRWTPTVTGGGNSKWENCRANGFDYGYIFGTAYDVARAKFGSLALERCEAHYCRVGMWGRHGVSGLEIIRRSWRKRSRKHGPGRHASRPLVQRQLQHSRDFDRECRGTRAPADHYRRPGHELR